VRIVSTPLGLIGRIVLQLVVVVLKNSVDGSMSRSPPAIAQLHHKLTPVLARPMLALSLVSWALGLLGPIALQTVVLVINLVLVLILKIAVLDNVIGIMKSKFAIMAHALYHAFTPTTPIGPHAL